MDNEERRDSRPPMLGRSTTTSLPTSGSARQLARSKGLAWVSALTLGAGAASALGAVVIASALPSPTLATSASPAATAATTPVPAAVSAVVNSAVSTDDDDDSGTRAQPATLRTAPKASTLKATAAPTTTKAAPVATSGAS